MQGLDRGVLAQQLVAATTLDKAQADALVAGLTREMCLIQGPPGTGRKGKAAVAIAAIVCGTTHIIVVVCHTHTHTQCVFGRVGRLNMVSWHAMSF